MKKMFGLDERAGKNAERIFCAGRKQTNEQQVFSMCKINADLLEDFSLVAHD